VVARADEEDDEVDEGDSYGETVGLEDEADNTSVAAPAARARRGAPSAPPPRRAPTDDSMPGQETQDAVRRHTGGSTTEDSRASSTVASPIETLRAEEIVRTRMFLKIALVIVGSALVAMAIAGGDTTAQLIVVGGCCVVAVSALWLLWVTRDPAGFTLRRQTIVATIVAAGTSTGTYYWGVASPAAAILVYGIYFFSFGGNARQTLWIYVFCSFLQLAIAVPVIAEWIPDRGLIKSTSMPLREQVMSQAVVQFLFACAFFTGRRSRRTLLDAVMRHEAAVRGVAHREALLHEARAELDRALRPGGPGRYTDQVVGSFKLGVLLGRGGMGEVYEARNVHDGGEAAVKLLHPGALADPQQVKRFVRETETIAKLDCAHVVSVLEVGTTGGEIPFLAMERLRGLDLAHQLRRRRKLNVAQVVTLVREVGVGLRAARGAGIVHRDIKPHKLFLAEQGGKRSWKILDFGVSKIGPSGTLTRGRVVGTPGYMAPEQARGEEVDYRADVYALAAIAYRCLTGHPPFTGKDVPTTLYDVVFKMPTRPSALTEIPADVDRALAIGIAKKAEDRFQDGSELADALEAAAAGALSEGLRLRGDALIERHPWGRRTPTTS
jgi:serine/threonine-protein kinase